MNVDFLENLNSIQRKAVEHPPDVPLQILAGPGSGKTRVLTSRIAYLILHHRLSPSSICAVTFTNKAANEMRERLTKLLGAASTRDVKLGTFHALCAMYLRKYGNAVGLSNNFSVCDADESKKLISHILQPYKTFLEAKDITLKEGTVLSAISKHKYKGRTATEVIADLRATAKNGEKENILPQSKPKTVSSDVDSVIGEVYREYEKSLRKSNSLDFDDLLLFGLQLFTHHRQSISWCSHVLVDEFQDTNSIQYDLMKVLALSANECLTVVGDPDQSIYGWRSADVTNLAKMRTDFAQTQYVLLEENYRSTAAILKASLAIVSQDKARLPKSLHTSHPSGIVPSLVSFASDRDEAAFIASEIKRMMAFMGGVLTWRDFAILLRFNALSRAIESALQKANIPCRILGGHRFFERMEIKDLLAYLQLVDNPQFAPAFSRAINVPPRGIGEKTLNELAARAEKTQRQLLDVVEFIHAGKYPDIKPPIKRKVPSFVNTIQTLRNLASDGTSPVDIIRRLIDLIGYEQYLKETQSDWESRWENVQELITFASEVDSEQTPSSDLEDSDGINGNTPLRAFLQASALSCEGDKSNTGDDNDKVSISTCHAAKGLEWPVVIIPSVEKGTFPFYRCDDVEEERRLLYVACTRAQCLLYLSHCTKRMVSGETKSTELSTFVSCLFEHQPAVFSNRTVDLLPADRAVVSRVLGRPEPDQAEVTRRIAEFIRTTRHRPHPSVDMPEAPAYHWHPSLTNSSGLSAEIMPSSQALLQPSKGQVLKPLPSQPVAPHMMGKAGTRMLPTKILHPKPLTTVADHPLLLEPGLPPSTPLIKVQTSSSSTALPSTTSIPIAGIKRRLGMGRSNVGYSNKKFKPPT